MDLNKNRRKMKDLAVNLPPSSVSASNSNTPRALLRSLVRFPKHCIRKRRKWGDEREGDDEGLVGPTALEGDFAFPIEEGKVDSEEKREEQVVFSKGRNPEDVSLNLGIGAGLVFLLVKSASEFNKMIELRKQMELLLNELKSEMQRKNVTSIYSESNNCTVISALNCWGDESTSNPISLQNDMEFDAHCKCETNLEKKRCLKINQLEEELEAELERLQVKSKEDSSVLREQQSMEIESENNNHSESVSASFVEASNEPKHVESQEHCGICPRELERRLHELLESRQQEKITELETALECAEKKLQEKETEICWWRDTAKLVSKHKEVMADKENIYR